jgi:general secretion pathway protein I
MTNGSRDAQGFTLIEVLVAFTILVLSIGALMPGFSLGFASIRAGTDTLRGLAYAQSLIDGTGHRGVITQGDFQDRLDNGRFETRLEVHPYGEESGQGSKLYTVKATVSWKDGRANRNVTISTLRFAEAH